MEKYSEVTEAMLERIDAMKLEIDALRPLKPEQEARIFQKFRLDWNYNSNSIEGNKLTYGETAAFLMEGLTAKGKPLKDHLDIKGHNEAIDYLIQLQKQDAELTEMDIRALHKMILVEPYQSAAQTADGQPTTKTIRLGEYKSMPNHVQTVTGAVHYYASVEDTPIMMRELIEWYRTNRDTMHPLVLSTLFHHKFVSIHPFDDGNGRMTRLLSNLILMKAGFPPLVIRQDEKGEYYGVLSQADAGEFEPLIQHFAERLIRSLDTYLRGARGEDISDASDIDKELALFVASFSEEEISKEPLTKENLILSIDKCVIPLLRIIIEKGRKINSLFFENNSQIVTMNMSSNGGIHERSEYQEVNTENFYNTWLSQPIHNVSLETFKKLKKTQKLRIIFSYFNNGFKANENTKPISNYIIFDFNTSHYSINTKSKSLKKHYPQHLTSADLSFLVESFLREVMDSIKAVVASS
ncbi:Fic family protein [Hymenobacter pini]|uniref:Fic family protein n=1 Tax=Hymenobacter pini TaxID=2880879 RepID=UPI001CF2B388|nr:Fic family protein [Hymenobacter pini]MCA8831973.1 Fic family protein [Hymenobacter pini]